MSRLESIFPELKGPRKKVHFVGVGGIGMSALARWFVAAFQEIRKGPSASSKRAAPRLVSGSDLVKSSITQELVKEGVEVKTGHKKRHINAGIGLVIHSLAARSDNPEITAAKRLKVPIFSYPEAVGRLTRHYKTIAVAGAHGKSTTTALTSLILMKAGLDPTVIVGTNLREFHSKNFRTGRSDWLVLEADEFGKSFLDYSPAIAVITNIDLEHLDTYKNLADIKNNFFKFLSNTRRGGTLVLNRDSKNLWSLKKHIAQIARRKNLKAYWYSISRHSHVFAVLHRVLKIPGEHNLSNALAAYRVGRALGIPHKKILSAIASFRGSWRRMEHKGKLRIKNLGFRGKKSSIFSPQSSILVYDDYAHHPTEIRATLSAFREKYPRSPVACVYQPHQALRLKKLWHGFVDAFGGADILILLPVYQVAGRDPSTSPSAASSGPSGSGRTKFNSKSLAAAIKRKYPNRAVFYLPNPKNIKKFTSQILPNSKSYILNPCVLIMMGAGDIADYTRLLTKSGLKS